MKIRLKSLSLENFKNIDSLNLNFKGNATIYGANESGKTTVYDSFIWLLFGKDSLNQSDFEIKKILLNGDTVHNLDHTVEAVLDVDGKEVKLGRVYKEKYLKKQGSAKKEFDGHSTTYYVNGTKSAANKYSAYVSSLIDENLFKLLSNPLYFNVNMKWQERRAMLESLCGEITNEEVAGENKQYKGLMGKLIEGVTIEDLKSQIKEKIKAINEKNNNTGIQIEALESTLPDDLGENTINAAKAEIEESEQNLEKLQNRLVEINSDTGYAFANNRVEELKTKQRILADTVEQENKSLTFEINMKLRNAQNKKLASEMTLARMKESLAQQEEVYTKYLNIENGLRESYFEEKAKEIEIETDCPACGQKLPDDKIESTERKLIEIKADNLEHIKKQGKEAKANRIATEERIAREKADVEKEAAELEEWTAEVEKITEEAKAIKVVDVEKDKRYTDLSTDIEKYRQAAATARNDLNITECEVRKKITEANYLVAESRKVIALDEQREKTKARIAELEAEEAERAKEYIKCEKQLEIINEFVSAKIAIVEKRIADKFKLVNFKMYEQHQKSEPSETCVSLYKGVPYNNWNNAARINGGLDIINAFSKHFDIAVPIFIDNVESVNTVYEMDTQLIGLQVSEDTELKMEDG